jgi:hypothetical protein
MDVPMYSQRSIDGDMNLNKKSVRGLVRLES